VISEVRKKDGKEKKLVWYMIWNVYNDGWWMCSA